MSAAFFYVCCLKLRNAFFDRGREVRYNSEGTAVGAFRGGIYGAAVVRCFLRYSTMPSYISHVARVGRRGVSVGKSRRNVSRWTHCTLVLSPSYDTGFFLSLALTKYSVG